MKRHIRIPTLIALSVALLFAFLVPAGRAHASSRYISTDGFSGYVDVSDISMSGSIFSSP